MQVTLSHILLVCIPALVLVFSFYIGPLGLLGRYVSQEKTPLSFVGRFFMRVGVVQ